MSNLSKYLVRLYAHQVIDGLKDISDVPEKYREAVMEVIKEMMGE